MPVVCINRPNRTTPRVFKERDVGRIVAYARNDGANDAVLIAHIMEGFGRRQLFCVIFAILDLFNTGLFIGAILTILSGILSIITGIKFLLKGRTKFMTSAIKVLLFLLPKSWGTALASWLLWLGAAEVLVGALIAFISAIANNIALFNIAKTTCEAQVQPYAVPVNPLDVGDLEDKLENLVRELDKLGVLT